MPSKNRYENNVVQCNFRASGAAAARTSCMLLGGSSPYQSRRMCSPVSSANSYKASQASPCHGRDAAASGTRRRIRSVELFAGFCPQVRFQQRSEPRDKHELMKENFVHPASSAWRQGGGVGHIEAEHFSAEGEGVCPASQKALQECTIYAHISDQHRDEHERNSASQRA